MMLTIAVCIKLKAAAAGLCMCGEHTLRSLHGRGDEEVRMEDRHGERARELKRELCFVFLVCELTLNRRSGLNERADTC